jgi:hypothetical protein
MDDATFAFLVRILIDIIALFNEVNNLLGWMWFCKGHPLSYEINQGHNSPNFFLGRVEVGD